MAMLTNSEFIILLRCENVEIGNELWNYIYAQERYLANLWPGKILRIGLCINQLGTYRTMERIVRRLWANPDSGLLAKVLDSDILKIHAAI